MNLGYLILAHESFSDLKLMLDTLSFYNNDYIFLHHDKKSKYNREISVCVEKYHNLRLIESIDVEWGEASIVYATLAGIELALTKDIDYLILLSGSCMPITTREALVKHLEIINTDCIECHDPIKGRWVKDGLEKERWEHFNFFNWRKDPIFFSVTHKIQSKLRIKRKFPGGTTPVLGSQWWCLKKDTLNKIVSFKNEYAAEKFIKKSWIPDEFFIQSIVNSTERNIINNNILMHYRFNDVGIPKVFTSADLNELMDISGEKFFARKIDKKDLVIQSFLSQLYCDSNLKGEMFEDNASSAFKFIPSKKKFIKDTIAPSHPHPIYVILFYKEINDELGVFCEHIKENLNLKFYGELFSNSKIDYGFEKQTPLYFKDDILLRDYDLRAFASIVFNEASTAIFLLNIDNFDKGHYAIQQFPNVKFIFPIISYKFESAARLLYLKKYLKSEGYDVIYDNDTDALFSLIESDVGLC